MNNPSALRFLIVLAVFLLAVLWLGSAVGNRDLLWFVPVFDARPDALCIYRYGAAVALEPSQPTFETLVGALNAELPQHAGYYEGLGLQGQSLDSYLLRGYAILAVYGRPVQVHTRFFFPANTHLLLAMDGSYNYLHAGTLLFRGDGSAWLPGTLALASDSLIRSAADAAVAQATGAEPAALPCAAR